MSTTDLSTAAHNYRTLQAEIKALQEQADAIKQTLIAEMDARQADTISAGQYTVRYTLYESKRIDTAKIKAAGLYDQYSATSTALRFAVT